MEKPRGPGGCFRDTLVAAGFDCTGLDIPAWVISTGIERICQELGLKTLPAGTVSLHRDRWYIAVTIVAPGQGHAQLMVGSRVPPEVVEVIPLPPETVITESLIQARLTNAGLTRVDWYPEQG